MNKTKTIVALHLMAVVVAAGVAVMTEEKVFAQPATPNTAVTSQTADQPDKDNLQQGDQTKDNPADSQSDGETNDDHNSASEGPNGDGDGEQPDTTESGK
jgi:cytoskeletal protein RodZ